MPLSSATDLSYWRSFSGNTQRQRITIPDAAAVAVAISPHPPGAAAAGTRVGGRLFAEIRFEGGTCVRGFGRCLEESCEEGGVASPWHMQGAVCHWGRYVESLWIVMVAGCEVGSLDLRDRRQVVEILGLMSRADLNQQLDGSSCLYPSQSTCSHSRPHTKNSHKPNP